METAHCITYQLKLDDFTALQKIGQGKNAVRDRWIVGSVVFFLLLFTGLTLRPGSQRTRPVRTRPVAQTSLFPMFLPPVMIAAVGVPFFLFIMRLQKKEQAEFIRELQHPTTARLEPEGFFTEGHHGESRQRWDTLHDIVETPTHLFLFLSKSTAHVIPKSAFDTSEQAAAFSQAAWRYWNTARES